MILVFQINYHLLHPNHILWYLCLYHIHISYHVLYFNMDCQVLNYDDNVKYLGFTFNSNQKDNN